MPLIKVMPTLSGTVSWKWRRSSPAAPRRNLRDYVFVDRHGLEVKSSSAAWLDSNVAYAGEPEETVNYVSAHDNETLFDCVMLRAADASGWKTAVESTIWPAAIVICRRACPSSTPAMKFCEANL